MKTNPNDSIQIQKYHETKGSLVHHKETTGLTKLEHFAGLAMQGILSVDCSQSYEFVGKEAVRYANALIAALNESSTEN